MWAVNPAAQTNVRPSTADCSVLPGGLGQVSLWLHVLWEAQQEYTDHCHTSHGSSTSMALSRDCSCPVLEGKFIRHALQRRFLEAQLPAKEQEAWLLALRDPRQTSAVTCLQLTAAVSMEQLEGAAVAGQLGNWQVTISLAATACTPLHREGQRCALGIRDMQVATACILATHQVVLCICRQVCNLKHSKAALTSCRAGVFSYAMGCTRRTVELPLGCMALLVQIAVVHLVTVFACACLTVCSRRLANARALVD